MTALPYHVDRTIVIRAARETVFRFFTDSALWAAWWGAGSTVGRAPGDAILVRHPGGVEAAGQIVEIVAPERFVFTYGYASGTPFGIGESLTTITLEAVADGTRLHLRHEMADAAACDHHVQGWRYQLSVFANVVADEAIGDVNALVDAWFTAWAQTEDDARLAAFSAITAPGVQFRDRYSHLDGREDLVAHVGAAHRFMPGMLPARRGEARHCQGTLIVDWAVAGADGQERGAGTNIFRIGPERTIESVTGIWNPTVHVGG